MLRLVQPPGGGKGTRPPKGRRSDALTPTNAEQARIRAAIRSLGRAYGTYACLAAAMGIPHKTLSNIVARMHRASYAVAVLLARAGGVSLEQLLAPGVSDASRCAVCGGRKGVA